MASAGIQPFTLEQSLVDICHSLTDLGFEKILMVHGHGGISSGQSALWQALQEKRPALYVDFMPYTACRKEIQALGGPFVAPSKGSDPQYPSLSGPGVYAVPSLNATQQGVYAGHAGYMETSMMLAVRPDLVDTLQMIQVIEIPNDGTARAGMIQFGDACLNLMAESTARIIRELASAPVPDQWRSIHSLLPISREE
jgi:creatinine amidohydrolase/Fe(II)-dependent formamide hydrolase-like protein